MTAPDGTHDVTEHTHDGAASTGYSHTHAWGSVAHTHHLWATCRRPECEGTEAHDIHPAPGEWSS